MRKLETIGLFLIVCCVMFLAGSAVGYQYCKSSQAKAQVKVLHGDAKKSMELEAAHVARQKHTEQTVKVIRQTVDDCATRPVPAGILDRLRS